MDEWTTQLQEYLVANKSNYAACLGFDTSSFQIERMAPAEQWDLVYADSSERPVTQEDGTSKKILIDEHACMMKILKGDEGDESKSGTKTGLWIAGLKYQVLDRKADFEVNNETVCLIHAKNKKKGAHIVQTKRCLLIGLYDEDKSQIPGVARTKVVAFADYLIQIGY